MSKANVNEHKPNIYTTFKTQLHQNFDSQQQVNDKKTPMQQQIFKDSRRSSYLRTNLM